ncbi:DUF2793 domain-containing protein [Roseitranquillus sediminis]|uniref:DUF2793 domain-containing protein n=1 Tax=Roseitranquillus sediminis TaxID=2809051 RepID=UPI0029C9CADA|nr:DUF2793 domain-containing protein [Roseitranquillus sediminis]
MTETTPNLLLPYILAAQAQKHVTLNEALRLLNRLVQLTVERRGAAGTPVNGACWIIGSGTSGE